jgi:hypothetical protein
MAGLPKSAAIDSGVAPVRFGDVTSAPALISTSASTTSS